MKNKRNKNIIEFLILLLILSLFIIFYPKYKKIRKTWNFRSYTSTWVISNVYENYNIQVRKPRSTVLIRDELILLGNREKNTSYINYKIRNIYNNFNNKLWFDKYCYYEYIYNKQDLILCKYAYSSNKRWKPKVNFKFKGSGKIFLYIYRPNGYLYRTLYKNITPDNNIISWDLKDNYGYRYYFDGYYIYLYVYIREDNKKLIGIGRILQDNISPSIRNIYVSPISNKPGFYGIYGVVFDNFLDEYKCKLNQNDIVFEQTPLNGLLGTFDIKDKVPERYKFSTWADDFSYNSKGLDKNIFIKGGNPEINGNYINISWKKEKMNKEGYRDFQFFYEKNTNNPIFASIYRKNTFIKNIFIENSKKSYGIIEWDGKNETGKFVKSGKYILKIKNLKNKTLTIMNINIKNIVSKIYFPLKNQIVRANVPIFGIIKAKNFFYAKLTYGIGNHPKNWKTLNYYFKQKKQKINSYKYYQENKTGNLSKYSFGGNFMMGIDEENDGLNGIITLKLEVFDIFGNSSVDSIPIVVGRITNKWKKSIIPSDKGTAKIIIPKKNRYASYSLFGFLGKSLKGSKLQPSDSYHYDKYYYSILPTGGRSFWKNVKLKIKFNINNIFGKAKKDTLNIQNLIKHLRICYYDVILRSWVPINTKVTMYDNYTGVATCLIKELPQYSAYYTIICPKNKPESPIIFDINNPLNENNIHIFGTVEKAGKIILSLESYNIDLHEYIEFDRHEVNYIPKENWFIFTKIKIPYKTIYVKAKLIDKFGYESNFSERKMFNFEFNGKNYEK
ncbi:MAG: hypothetical protein ACTSXH_02540 [Promethearchaeota archaeon]